MTPTNVCNMMNAAYEVLKTMTVAQIKEAAKVADKKMGAKDAALFKHQCNFALMKKRSGAW